MTHKIIRIVMLLSLGMLASTHAQQQVVKQGQNKLNQELVGKRATDFILKNHRNKDVKLSSFKGKKNVVLIFNRAHW